MKAITAQEIVLSVHISTRAKLVFQALASFSNKTDTCYPSINKIADRAGISVNGVRRGLADLIAVGLASKLERFRKDGGCTANLYILSDTKQADIASVKFQIQTASPSQFGRGDSANLGGGYMPASADTHCSQPSFLNTELVNYEIVLDYDSDRAHEKLLLHSNETSGDSLDTNTGGNNEIISAESGVTMSADKTGSEQYCKNIEFSLPEKKDKRNMKHHSQTLKPELSEGTDLTSDNSDFPLSQLIAQCDLDMFEDDELYGIDGSSVASVLRESLTRLYFSKELRLGGVTLPRNVFFPVLRSLDCTILGSALERFTTRPKNKIRNPIAYLSAVIYNSITEDDALFLGTYHVCSGSSITQRHSRTLTVTPYEPNDSMLQDWKNLCTTQVFGSRLEAIN